MSRPYYYCKTCRKCSFGESQEQEDISFVQVQGRISPQLSELICLIAQEASSFEAARDILHRTLLLRISTSTVQQHSEKIGSFLLEKERQECQYTTCSIIKDLLQNKPKMPQRSYIQIDGAMINTTEGWKENKLGLIFNEADTVKKGEGEKQRVSIKKKQLVSSLGEGIDDFERRLRYHFHETGTLKSQEIVAVSDGALWIEKMIERNTPKAVHILDWFHVTEHLWDTAKKLFGEKSEKSKPWVSKYKHLIWNGKIDEALKLLSQEMQKHSKCEPLGKLYRYFEPRKEKMRYDRFRKKGYYIGSGAIEAANKYAVQSRLKKTGMRWTIEGANAIAFLKTQYHSGKWEDIWQSQEAA